jgi:DnaJ family protein C protein 2
MKQKKVESAGHGFFDKFERMHLKESEATASTPDPSDIGSEEPGGKKKKGKSKTQQNRTKLNQLKIIDALKDECLFEVLGISEETSADEIKGSYRQLVLANHPDKKGSKLQAKGELTEDKKKEIELGFIKIQESYNILSDEDLRRKYISSLDFDDSIPSGKARTNDEFFKVFDKAFTKFARWSTKTPVPHIGHIDTPYSDVEHFYDFWGRFQSWRDPLEMLAKDEEELHDLENAECREERRWMERENGRMAKVRRLLHGHRRHHRHHRHHQHHQHLHLHKRK